MTAVLLLAYVATIPVANWMIGHVGQCVPNGPCLVPVGFGLMAPSGVLMIGLALVFRDLVQRRAGPLWALAAILAGSVLSLAVAAPGLALASGVAFLFSELADFAVYTPLARRRLALAVFLSGVMGAVVDSALFLWLAFGSLDFIAGQVLGKTYAGLVASTLIAIARCSDNDKCPERIVAMPVQGGIEERLLRGGEPAPDLQEQIQSSD